MRAEGVMDLKAKKTRRVVIWRTQGSGLGPGQRCELNFFAEGLKHTEVKGCR